MLYKSFQLGPTTADEFAIYVDAEGKQIIVRWSFFSYFLNGNQLKFTCRPVKNTKLCRNRFRLLFVLERPL